ncbi:ATP-binding cassette sub-family G member 2 [Micractinium conductrix]|uniref:ATP-binding cassette sub-family G member 2 n=1 Tax=Micractinium conductrix TaxID=554055 RepID=A0A2P6V6U9_9CHLO|nr:ATP-binding cassette sub-family G member 2 [Micractinium conductrix]|eukprot:PSC69816.1 ATP-binding cassette sub-family G member 2 [Micractinium conductrix]
MTTQQDAAVEVTFQGLTFTVQPRGGGPPLELLKGLSGAVRSGRCLAIMGASGAGKTTLLDVLAGHDYSGTVGGKVLVNGRPRRLKAFLRISSYVQQRDVLMAAATVREAITTAALLKLPRAMPATEKRARVDGVLADMELEGCQHTLIGDELQNMKGISGGQRRRVSVGIELVKQPQVLFLDEPTSGLDSEMAVSMMETLLRLARGGRSVCLSIHQPNSIITGMFDDFMLLVGGRAAYAGPWSGAVDLFASAGFPCPQYRNPTDHFLSVLRDAEATDAVVACQTAAAPALVELPSMDDGEGKPGGKGKEADEEAGLAGVAHNKGGALEVGGSRAWSAHAAGDAAPAAVEAERPRVPFAFQTAVLSVRMLRNWGRNPMMLAAEAVQYLFLALFVGLVYLQLSDSVETGVPDRLSSLWFVLAILSFTPSYTAMVSWDSERLLVRRETGQGMYRPAAWFAAKTLTLLPVSVAQTTTFAVITYWMVGYAADAGRFFVYVALLNMFQLTSETLGLLCALCTSRSTYAVILLTFVLLVLMTFTGFLVTAIPPYFGWIKWASYLNYTYAAMVNNEFKGVTFYSAADVVVPGADLVPSAVNNGLGVLANGMAALGLMVATRLTAFLVLLIMHRLKKI